MPSRKRLVSSRLVPSRIPRVLSRAARIILVYARRSRRLSHPDPRSLSSHCALLRPRRMLSSSRALSLNVFQLASSCPRPRFRCPARYALPVACYLASLRRLRATQPVPSHRRRIRRLPRLLPAHRTSNQLTHVVLSQRPRLCLLGDLYRSRLPLSTTALSCLVPRSPGPQIRNSLFLRLDLYRVSLLCLVLRCLLVSGSYCSILYDQ
ncbi:uncharacterized protein C8Q71DRAFT_905821 [Rhodofomes roseus]|uniref:Uncharacterized protein n=1 Tax=Rhodofomes roseus TaxID=34475 RepID=A0ABQ8KLQ8_9APHY|nr:uncharacterized protein C8Q71DRAFT_905821 [Rhodofomes roseus]KAH9839247.1 hypothetical protein C8Q71DRAFT_905821 [Rhodofomes roseus]